MTECWSPGDLRAASDRELPPETLERIAAHLEECSECRAVHAELAARAARVAVRMEELLSVPRPSGVPARPGLKRLWPVPLALAAGLAIGWLVLPKRVEAPRQAGAPPVAAPIVPAQPAPPPAEASHEAAPKLAQVQRAVRPRRTRPSPPRPQTVDFVALDDRPIETGVVMRVSWGPENLQADIIFGPDGSARAYRLVNANFKY